MWAIQHWSPNSVKSESTKPHHQRI